MRRRVEPNRGLPLIDPGDAAPTSPSTDRIEVRRPRLPVVGLVIGLIVATAWALSFDAGGVPVDRNEGDATPTTQGESSGESSGETTDTPLDEAIAAPELREVLGQQLIRAVVGSRQGGEHQLLSVSADAIDVVELPALNDFVFDSSGEWLAATSMSELGDPHRILWVAPAGGSFEPVAVDVRGFAWHEEAPGRLAWTLEERTTVSTLDVGTDEIERQTVPLSVEGALRGWGDWGFALQTSYRLRDSAVVSPQGALMAEELPGVYAGTWFDGRLVFSGGASSPMFVETADWEREPIEWLGVDDYVWTMSSTSTDSVALVTESGLRGDPFVGSVIRTNDDAVQAASEASAYTRVAWVNGAVVFAEQSTTEANSVDPNAQLILVTADGSRIAIPLPADLGERTWIDTIAVSR